MTHRLSMGIDPPAEHCTRVREHFKVIGSHVRPLTQPYGPMRDAYSIKNMLQVKHAYIRTMVQFRVLVIISHSCNIRDLCSFAVPSLTTC